MRRLGLVPLLLALATVLPAQIIFSGPQGPALTPPASNTPPEQRCTISGRVTNAQTGEPIRKAAVRLQRQASLGTVSAQPFNGQQGYSTTSEADGSFTIQGIEPGDYMLSGERTGYLNTQYGSSGFMQSGTILTLKPSQQMTAVNLALLPQAVISGKVVDQDGDPVSGAMVQVMRQMWQRGKSRYMAHGMTQTNDLGEFRSANLPPGKYYVCAQKMNYGMGNETQPAAGKPDMRPVRTCYPEATTMQEASQLEVKAGQDLADINIRMRSTQTYHVRGRIVGALPSGDEQRARVILNSEGEQGFFFGNQTVVTKDQTFDIAGVAPGSYMLNALVMGGAVRSVARQAVEVSDGDVNDLIVNVIQPGSLHGTVRLDGTPPAGTATANLSSIHVRLSGVDETMMFGGAPNGQTKPDGSFTLDNVSPGKYYVNANAPQGTYLQSVRFGGQEIEGKELDLSQGASGNLELVFRYGAAEIDGAVQMPQDAANNNSGAPPASAQVALVPDVLNPDGSGMRFANTTDGGGFAMKQIPPGEYHIYAFQHIDYDALQNPDLLKQLAGFGKAVELKENDKQQIQLSLIPADQLQQILARAGIDSTQ